MKTLTMDISGMTCGHCVNAVKQALTAVHGVEVESVAIGSATVRYDDAVLDAAAVKNAVIEEGYLVTAAH